MTEDNNTHHVVFQPSGRQGRVPHGITLLEAGRLLGVEIEAICGGRQTCGKCQVIVEEGEFPKHDLFSSASHLSPPDESEQRFWAERPHLHGRRLSCTACVLGDLMIGVPEESQARKQVVRKAAGSRPVTVAPPIRLYYVEIEAATLGDPLGIWDRAAAELEARFGLRDTSIDPVLLPELYGAAAAERAFTLTVWQGRQVVRVQPGYHEQALGIAADIGTTTIALHLCDLRTGEVLATASQMNPQVSYGEDLMSRVSFCDIRPDGLELLHGAAIAALNRLAGEAAAEAGVDQEAITDAVLVGNTVMHHILLNIPPSALGYSPFEPAISDAVDIKARDFGLSIAPAGWVHLLPIEAGHVGADNVGVLLAEEPHHAPADEVWLVVDVGTNGELLLGNCERLYSASSPTGPAFEGAQIRHGMRAAPGAIERVRIDPETLEVNFRIIGRGPWSQDWQERPGHKALLATGICGSGIIEAVAELFLAGLLTPNGRFVRGVRSARMLREGPHARVRARLARAERHRQPDRHHRRRRARHPAGQSGALLRGEASDGALRDAAGRSNRAGRSVRELHRPAPRNGARDDPRLRPGARREHRQRRRRRRPRCAAERRAA